LSSWNHKSDLQFTSGEHSATCDPNGPSQRFVLSGSRLQCERVHVVRWKHIL
jgi:hypothetical protein